MKGLVNKKRMELWEPYDFPIDNLLIDFKSNLNLLSFKYLNDYIKFKPNEEIKIEEVKNEE